MNLSTWKLTIVLILCAAVNSEDVFPPTLPEFEQANLTRGPDTLRIVTEKRIIKLVNVPDIIQSTTYTCGPSSLMAVLRYFGLPIRESEIADLAGTIPFTGTGPIMLENGFNKIVRKYGFQDILSFDRRQNMTLPELEDLIRNEQPVIVLLQVFKPQNDTRSYVDWNERGHYIVAVGMDDTYFYFQDPKLFNNIMHIEKNDFNDRWHDYLNSEKRLATRVGIIVSRKDGKKPKYQQRVVQMFD